MRKLLWILLLCVPVTAIGQNGDTVRVWSLKDCIDYAMENNIQLRQSRNEYLSGMEDTRQAKAAILPSLSASTSQSLSNYPSNDVSDNNMYTGSYNLNARMSLFQGGSLATAVKQGKVQNEIDLLSIEETANDIRTAIIEAYMQCLYADESVTVARSTADASKAQRDRAEEMWKAGSISKVDFAQLESQWMSDEYQVVSAQTSLDNYRLQLKQLLELDIMEEMNLAGPEVSDVQVMSVLPSKTDVYAAALSAMPEVERGRLSVPLDDEVHFIQEYVDLMRLRLPRHVKVDVSLPERSGVMTAPLMFIALVENAFKHGVSNDRPSYVSIRIALEDGAVVCETRNSYFPKSGGTDRSGSGIGLSNLSRRLEMLYPGQYRFEYGLNGEEYRTYMRIPL